MSKKRENDSDEELEIKRIKKIFYSKIMQKKVIDWYSFWKPLGGTDLGPNLSELITDEDKLDIIQGKLPSSGVYEDIEAYYNIVKELLINTKKLHLKHKNENLSKDGLNFIEQTIQIIESKVASEEHFKKYGLIIKGNEVEEICAPNMKNIAQIFINFDQTGYIPGPHAQDNTGYFTEILHEIYRFNTTPPSNNLKELQDELKMYGCMLKGIIEAVENDNNNAKLINWGMDKELIGKKLISMDVEGVKKFCDNLNASDTPNSYDVADHFVLLPLAREITQFIYLIEEDIFANINFPYNINGTSPSEIDKTFSIVATNAEATNNAISILIADKGNNSWNHQMIKAKFESLKPLGHTTFGLGTGNEIITSNTLSKFLFATKNSLTEIPDTAFVMIMKHGNSIFNPDIHKIVSSVPKDIAKNTIYYLNECYSELEFNEVNLEVLRQEVPVGHNCIFISAASVNQPAYGKDSFKHQAIKDYFTTGKPFIISNISKFIEDTVKFSTPKIIGIYNNEIVTNKTLESFCTDQFSVVEELNELPLDIAIINDLIDISKNEDHSEDSISINNITINNDILKIQEDSVPLITDTNNEFIS